METNEDPSPLHHPSSDNDDAPSDTNLRGCAANRAFIHRCFVLYERKMLATAYNTMGLKHPDVRDVLQDAWIQLLQRPEPIVIQNPADEAKFFCRVVENLALNRIRYNAVRERDDGTTDQLILDAATNEGFPCWSVGNRVAIDGMKMCRTVVQWVEYTVDALPIPSSIGEGPWIAYTPQSESHTMPAHEVWPRIPAFRLRSREGRSPSPGRSGEGVRRRRSVGGHPWRRRAHRRGVGAGPHRTQRPVPAPGL